MDQVLISGATLWPYGNTALAALSEFVFGFSEPF